MTKYLQGCKIEKRYAELCCNGIEVWIKSHTVTHCITHNHGKAAAIMGIEQFDKTEKRLVRLENNMSTLMRYIFRLGARVFINCQYYGGQSTFQKYRCIRCMKDDRCGDGSLMQIDQCLCCTRYEPIFGKYFSRLKVISHFNSFKITRAELSKKAVKISDIR